MKRCVKNIIVLLVIVIFVFQFSVLVACQPNTPKPDTPTPPKPDDQHEHSLTHVAAKAESCDTDGMKEHWDCDSCGKTFSDSKAEHEVDKDSLVIKAHHTLTHQTEKKATCTADGNIDYYHCTACGENFLDANGENKVALDDTVVESQGHVVGTQWERDKNGHWKTCSACGEKVEYAQHNFKNYVCQDCGLVDEQNKPMSKQEITEKVVEIAKENIQYSIGKNSTINKILAIDCKKTDLYVLVDNHKVEAGTEADYYSLVKITMSAELTDYNLKNNLFKATGKRVGLSLLDIPKASQDERGVQILKKVDPQNDHNHYDFVSVIKGTGAILEGIGATNAIKIYTIDKTKIQYISINAKRDGAVVDPIGESILNGESGKTYLENTDARKEFDFSDNVIYNFNGLLNNTKSINQEETQEM